MTDQNTEETELSEDEQLEQMIAEEEAQKSETFEDGTPAGDDEKDDPDIYDAVAEFREKYPEEQSDEQTPTEEEPAVTEGEDDTNTPVVPTPEQTPTPPVAPAAVDPAAVETTASGLKFGWQQPPVRDYPGTMHCSHIGTVAARQQLRYQEIGHTWVCTCGAEFEVVLNTAGKKILKAKKD